MKPWSTPWTPRPSAAAACAGGALVLLLLASGCVTRGTFDQVVRERDELAEQRNVLTGRVQRLETSKESLEVERVELLGEIEDLRETKLGLERDVRTLQKAHADAESELDLRQAQIEEREEALTARDVEIAAREEELVRLRATYDGMVEDLQSEVESGRMEIERLRGVVTFQLSSQVLFAPGSSDLAPEGRQVLSRIGQRVRRERGRVEVHGYTDNVPIRNPSSRYPSNWELAGARASRVVRMLIEQGVTADRLVAISHADQAPIADNETPEGRAQNRRIEIRVVPEDAPAAAAAP